MGNHVPDTKKKYLVKYNRKYGQGAYHSDSIKDAITHGMKVEMVSGQLRVYKKITSFKPYENQVLVSVNKHILSQHRLGLKKYRSILA